jgi:ribonuclease HI
LAELVALTEALKLSKEQRVNIYSDSMYAFLILHAHTAIWKGTRVLTATGTTSHRDKMEITPIVLGITALIVALAGISYGLIANHVTTKKNTTSQSSRGHLRPGRPNPLPGPRFSFG